MTYHRWAMTYDQWLSEPSENSRVKSLRWKTQGPTHSQVRKEMNKYGKWLFVVFHHRNPERKKKAKILFGPKKWRERQHPTRWRAPWCKTNRREGVAPGQQGAGVLENWHRGVAVISPPFFFQGKNCNLSQINVALLLSTKREEKYEEIKNFVPWEGVLWGAKKMGEWGGGV